MQFSNRDQFQDFQFVGTWIFIKVGTKSSFAGYPANQISGIEKNRYPVGARYQIFKVYEKLYKVL